MISPASYQFSLKSNRIPLVLGGVALAIGLGVLQAVSVKWSAALLVLVLVTVVGVCKMEAAIVIYALAAFMPIGPFFAVTGRFGYQQGLYPCELLLGLLVFLWAIRLLFSTVRDKKLPIQRGPIDAPLFLLIGASVFSFIAAQFTWDYNVPIEHRYYVTQITEIGLLCMPVAVYLLISNSVTDVRYIKAIFWAVLAVGVIGFLSDCPWIQVPSWLGIRWTGLLVVPLISFLYSYIIVHKEFGGKQLVAACLLAVLLTVQFRYTSWVVMWLSACVSLCTISWYRSKKLFAAVACVVLITFLFKLDLFKSMLESEAEEQSMERFGIWATSVRMGLSRPLWGIGPDSFYPYYASHYAEVYDSMAVSSPHSNWIQMFVQYGIIGFAAFVWFIVACLRNLPRLYKRARGTFQKVIFLTVIGTFTGMAIISGLGDYIFPARANGGLTTFGITVYTWILLGLAFALGRLLPARESAETVADQRVEPAAA